MQKIKFRGKTSEDKFIYGDLIHIGGDAYIKSDKGGWIIEPVDENSVSQFVGYDENGKEIFEGDILQNQDREFWVRIIGSATVKSWDIGDKVYCWKLKE